MFAMAFLLPFQISIAVQTIDVIVKGAILLLHLDRI